VDGIEVLFEIYYILK